MTPYICDMCGQTVPEKGLRGGKVAAPRDTLDAAWSEAEAALPREALIRVGRTGMTATGWATAYLRGEHIGTAFDDAGPAAALRKLVIEYRA